MTEAFGGKGFMVEDPKDLRGALDEAMNHKGQRSSTSASREAPPRKPQEFRWHS